MKFSTYCLLLSTIVPIAFPLNSYSKVSVKSSPVDHYSRSKSLNQKNFINKSTKNSNSPHSKTNQIIDTREITEIPDEIEIIKKPDITETPEEMEIIEPDESNVNNKKGSVDTKKITDPLTAPFGNVFDRNAIIQHSNRKFLAEQVATMKLHTMPYDELLKLQHALIFLIPFFQTEKILTIRKEPNKEIENSIKAKDKANKRVYHPDATFEKQQYTDEERKYIQQNNDNMSILMNFYQAESRSDITIEDIRKCIKDVCKNMILSNYKKDNKNASQEDAEKKTKGIINIVTKDIDETFKELNLPDKQPVTFHTKGVVDNNTINIVNKLQKIKKKLETSTFTQYQKINGKIHTNPVHIGEDNNLNSFNENLRFTEDRTNEQVTQRYDPVRSVDPDNNIKEFATGVPNYNYYDMSRTQILEAKDRLERREKRANIMVEWKELTKKWNKLISAGTTTNTQISITNTYLSQQQKELLESIQKFLNSLRKEIRTLMSTKLINENVIKNVTALNTELNELDPELNKIDTELNKMKKSSKIKRLKAAELEIQKLKRLLESIKMERIITKLKELLKLDNKNIKMKLKSELYTARKLGEKINILNKFAELHAEMNANKTKSLTAPSSTKKKTQKTVTQQKK